MLGYSQWRRFEEAVKQAMTSCEASGNNPAHHFAGVGKMVGLGSGSQREKKRRELFDRQDEIQRKRDDLTDELERQLKQESTVSTLLICR